MELVFATFFFSLFLPVWGRLVSRYASEVLMNWFEDGTKYEVAIDRMLLVVNFFLDLIRFVYGRGILFKVSSLLVFFLLVLKDTAYQIWHFGFKYVESYFIFVLKVYTVDGRASFSPFWQKVAVGVETFVRMMGIPKSLAVCFEEEVDYKDYMALGETEDDLSTGKIRVVFCNMAVTVRNLPKKLGKVFRQAALARQAVEARKGPGGFAASIARRMSDGMGDVEMGGGSAELGGKGVGAKTGGKQKFFRGRRFFILIQKVVPRMNWPWSRSTSTGAVN